MQVLNNFPIIPLNAAATTEMKSISLQQSPSLAHKAVHLLPAITLHLTHLSDSATKDAGVLLIDTGHTLLRAPHPMCRGDGHPVEKEEGGPAEPGGSQPHRDTAETLSSPFLTHFRAYCLASGTSRD